VVLVFLMVLRLEASGQQKDLPTVYAMESSFFVTLSSGLAQKASIRKAEGPYTVTASPQPVWEAGVDYRTSLGSTVYSLIGFRTTVTGRNALFEAPIEKISPGVYSKPHPPLKMIEYGVSVAVPALVEKVWRRGAHNAVFVQGGVNLRYSLGYDSESYGFMFQDTSGRWMEVFSLDLNSKNGNKPWLTCQLGGGYSWRLRNYNVLKAGVQANISRSKVVSGTYLVSIPGEPPTWGMYSLSESYVALSVSYGFTRNKKRIRALEEKPL
jgi:hypothetical protein